MDVDRNGLEVLDRDEGFGLLAGASGGDLLDAALARIVSDALAEWDRIQGDTPDLLYQWLDSSESARPDPCGQRTCAS